VALLFAACFALALLSMTVLGGARSQANPPNPPHGDGVHPGGGNGGLDNSGHGFHQPPPPPPVDPPDNPPPDDPPPNREPAPTRGGGGSTSTPTAPTGISGVAGDNRTRMLNDPLPAHRFVWRLDRGKMIAVLDMPASASKRIEVPLQPMLGRIAVAPAGEQVWEGLWPGDFGGNMDASDVGPGATVYLPVFHPGALFYFGDFHALQGDGEIAGSGLESTADVTFQFDLIKARSIRWPRIENDEYIMVAGSIRPLIDAFRIAYVELIEWLVSDYGFDKMDAYQVASQAGVVRVANVVDPNYTVVAKFPKRLLPAKTVRPSP